ncbi:hypothetical protein ACI2KH_20095 [Roseomonas mucosa]|uniref:hypothetical protein n=1 Tax=Roseomonas mucosa TaxID=207340 RepID=UPI00384E57C5
MSASTVDILGEVTSSIREELSHQRANGVPLKAAWHAVARALGCISPRRAKAIHYGEVSEEDIRAREWIAATELRNRRRRARIAAARALLAQENPHDPNP